MMFLSSSDAVIQSQSGEMKVPPLEFEKPIAELEERLESLREKADRTDLGLDPEVSKIEEKIDALRKEIYSNLTAWQRVTPLARLPWITSGNVLPTLPNCMGTDILVTMPPCHVDWLKLPAGRLRW